MYYNVYTCNIIFYMGLSRREWVDGIGTGSDDDFPIRQVLTWGLILLLCSVFTAKKNCISRYSICTCILLFFYDSRGAEMVNDVVILS